MMAGLGNDKYAIAYSGIRERTPQVKALALSVRDGAPYIPFSLETVANRSYPLAGRCTLPQPGAAGKPQLDPEIAEFLRFI